MDFVAVLGGVASAIAVATFVAAVWRFGRRRSHRHGLRQMTERLKTLADDVKSTAVEIDHRHSDGAEWTGWAVSLGPHIQLLDRVVTESEALTAQARGMATDSTLDRLRADVENASVVLRTAANLYRDATISNYREHMGIPIPPGATGRDTTAALTAEMVGPLDQTRRTFTLLIRTCLYQLGEEAEARMYDVGWPILRPEIISLRPGLGTGAAKRRTGGRTSDRARRLVNGQRVVSEVEHEDSTHDGQPPEQAGACRASFLPR
jgi:hypothetical protein